MAYWIYENTLHKTARIHSGECSFCRDGRGVHSVANSRVGSWLGPIPTLAEAMIIATSLKHMDTRNCRLCLPNLACDLALNASIGGLAEHNKRNNKLRSGSTLPNDAPYEWQKIEKISASINLSWRPIGRIVFDSGEKLVFPNSAPALPGIYRLLARSTDGKFSHYVGESDNLKRRFTNYRNPGPTQQTSKRIHKWLVAFIESGGEVSVSIATAQECEFVDVPDEQVDFSKKNMRLIFENLAIARSGGALIELLNR